MTPSSISLSHVISFTAFATTAVPFPASTHALPLLVAQSRGQPDSCHQLGPTPSRCCALDLYPRTHPSTAAQLHGEALYAGDDWLGML
ncbi:hypothetical protein B0H14DRAFT_2678666 [Mycena olivaceomarginata]|nr:hypothetical protein B0H14DRAFT_2678666 [Mycena olivaceomarginata]